MIRRALWIIIVSGVLWPVLFRLAHGQDYSHTHEGDVGKFYSTWGRPKDRTVSCCNRMDCRPVVAMHRNGAGTFSVQMQEPNGTLTPFYPVPDNIWEDAQSDPRESPDGRIHACVRNGLVICAVRASDQ